MKQQKCSLTVFETSPDAVVSAAASVHEAASGGVHYDVVVAGAEPHVLPVIVKTPVWPFDCRWRVAVCRIVVLRHRPSGDVLAKVFSHTDKTRSCIPRCRTRNCRFGRRLDRSLPTLWRDAR